MSNSKLIDYVKITQNKRIYDDQGLYYMDRNAPIQKITVHHMAGNYTIEELGESFSNPARGASSNYGIGSDGRIGLYVEEKYRAWTSGDVINDGQAINIEVANNSGAPNWSISNKAWESLVKLCVDICERNGIEQLNYTGNSNGNLTTHRMFQPTECPGPYLNKLMPTLAERVNKILSGEEVEVSNEFEYIVKAGDSLWSIAQNTLGDGSRYEEIKEYNNLDSNFIYAGMILKIPCGEPQNQQESNKTNPYPEPTSNLRYYVTGERVKWIQWELKEAGYELEIDGSFGPATDKIVKDFQKSKGLTANGVVDSTTREYLKNPNKEIKVSNPYKVPVRALVLWTSGEDVKWLQWELNQLGYSLEVDGSFGPATDKAVRQYQKINGLVVDGSVGPATIKSIVND